MKMIKGFSINFKLLCVALAVVSCLFTSCETIDSVERDAEHQADRRNSEGRNMGKPVVYHGLAFDIMLPPNMKTNTKKSDREIIHYFFTPEMASRKVGMGIYEGVAAKSMVRLRKDLIEEDSSPAEIDMFVGNSQRGATYRGKRWCEYFLFPKESNFTLQIWWFDVTPEDEAVFRELIRTIRATYLSKARD